MSNYNGQIVSSSTPFSHLPPHLTVGNSWFLISTIVSSNLPNNLHENCFGINSGHVHTFVLKTFPSSVLCDADYFYSNLVFSRLRIALANIFSDFVTCKNTHNNFDIQWICVPTFQRFSIQVRAFLFQWHILQNKDLPSIYELYINLYQTWKECSLCKYS